MSTLKEVAERAGVSLSTASRILNRDETMAAGEETRRAVFAAAAQLDYLPPRLRRQQGGPPLVIGVAAWQILGDRPNVELTALCDCAAALRPERTVQFVHLTPQGTEPVDGIIALGDLNEREAAQLRRRSPHLVFVNSDRSDFLYDRIIVELTPALDELFGTLSSAWGYGTAGYIGGLYQPGNGVCIGRRRSSSLIRTLRQRGLFCPQWVRIGEMTPESGYALTREMAAQGPLPRLLLLGSDQTALGVMRALEELGLQVPGQVALVLYRDIETVDLPRAFTQIRMYPDFLWTTAVGILVERILHGRTEVTRVLVPARLVLGETTEPLELPPPI